MQRNDREFMDGVLHGLALALLDLERKNETAAARVLRERRRQIERMHARDLEEFIKKNC